MEDTEPVIQPAAVVRVERGLIQTSGLPSITLNEAINLKRNQK